MTTQAFGHTYSRADLSALRRVFERFSVTYGAAMSDDDRSAYACKLLAWMADGCRDESHLFQRIVTETRGEARVA